MGVRCSLFFFFSSRRRHTRWPRDWSSDVCSSDLRNTSMTGTSVDQEVTQFGLMRERRFLPLFITQFGGAFNDNFYRAARSEERRVGKDGIFCWKMEHSIRK